jgi:ABC-2 type transport system ATP-binding protein
VSLTCSKAGPDGVSDCHRARGAGQQVTTPAIRLDRVCKRFGDFEALAGVSLEIAQGEFFGLLGPNGAGKTTLISIVSGLTRVTSGDAYVMGHHVTREYREARRALGVVPQELVFDPFFTVRETLRIQSGYYGIRDNDPWIDEVMEHLDLTSKADTNMRALSGGMKRRVLVGQALVHKPPVIVLDEPTAGVDVELRQALWRFIRQLNRDGHTIVLTTHYLEEAETLCGRIAMLKQGRIVALDSTQNLLRRHSGCYAELRIDPDRLPESLAARVTERLEGGAYRLALADYDELATLMATLRAQGVEVRELEVMQPDLEEVFVQIMRGSEGVKA